MKLIAKAEDSEDSEESFTEVIEYLKCSAKAYPPLKLSPAKWSK